MPSALFSAPDLLRVEICDVAESAWPRMSWGLVLLIVAAVFFILFGSPLGIGTFLAACIAILLAWRFPYASFYLMLGTSLLLGWLVALPTPGAQWEQAVGQTIDLLVGEVVALAVIVAWALRLLFLWQGRRDHNWKPWLPFVWSYAAVVAAHAVSALSPYAVDPLMAIKYTFRPVWFVYLTSLVIPVNFIRSKRRLLGSLLTVSAVSSFFALDGLRSLFISPTGDFQLTRARPLLIWGVNALGGNHNALAEVMLFGTPAALAAGVLVKSLRARFVCFTAAGVMTLVALLTFARSAWIVLVLQIIFLFSTVWRRFVREHWRSLALGSLIVVPLVVTMIGFSLSDSVKSSTDARAMLAGIAWNLFRDSPLIGIGAGGFPERVSRVWAFVVDFGAPLDAHGLWQKLAAETGLLGLVAFVALVIVLARWTHRVWLTLRPDRPEIFVFAFLSAAVLGAFVYQWFSTSIWTPRLWLPVGLLLAAGRVFLLHAQSDDPDFLSSHG